MMPVVGVVPLWDDEKQSLWMLPGYMDGLRRAGCLPLMLPLTNDENEINQMISMVDGILFTGGHDVSPQLYGETPLDDSVVICRMRDEMETILLKKALKLDKSVLGICRGIQIINAILGGTLYQDIPTQYSSDLEHHQSAPYDVPVHKVTVMKGSPLYDLVKMDKLCVNSYHHQSVKELASDLTAMAKAEDGLVEAVYKPDQKFLWAVQWHPEFSYLTDETSCLIFQSFSESMKR